jgi:hypothetical protein
MNTKIKSFDELFELAKKRKCVTIYYSHKGQRSSAMYVANMSAMYVHRMIVNGHIETYNCKHPPSALKRTKDKYELVTWKSLDRKTMQVTWSANRPGNDLCYCAATEAGAVNGWCEAAKLPYLTKASIKKQQTKN